MSEVTVAEMRVVGPRQCRVLLDTADRGINASADGAKVRRGIFESNRKKSFDRGRIALGVARSSMDGDGRRCE